MITNRFITDNDYSILAGSLLLDEYHKDTPAGFFYADGTVCSVYEDENGPICFVRGKPITQDKVAIIQLDIQYVNNRDARRNMRAMLEGLPELEKKARENGFSGFFFVSNVPLLRQFCIKRLGFEAYGEDCLVKVLQEK
jgi:hypothetical protein